MEGRKRRDLKNFYLELSNVFGKRNIWDICGKKREGWVTDAINDIKIKLKMPALNVIIKRSKNISEEFQPQGFWLKFFTVQVTAKICEFYRPSRGEEKPIKNVSINFDYFTMTLSALWHLNADLSLSICMLILINISSAN